jgi:hypothetical protein
MTQHHMAEAALPAADVVDDALLRQMDEQLATIIASARSVAIAAEELLRELHRANEAGNVGQRAIAMAPRLLAATDQQLQSVAAMLRKA